MSFRTGLLGVVDAVRGIPLALDVRPHQLTIRTRTWDGGDIGLGTPTNVDLVLPAKYPVRRVKESEIDGSAGEYQMSDILVDHITPSNGAGVGYTKAQLDPPITASNVEVIYIVTGPEGGQYGLRELRMYKSFTWQLVLCRKLATP